MRFQPLVLSAIIATSLFSGSLQANELRKVFDYYAQGSPGTYSTQDMKYWQGASFSARNSLSEPNLFQMPTINIGGSCKGIDFHAGGFGLVTKDELVQMARGIAQGAPGYFFNMAIGAVCSSCLQNINEYMRKLERFNEIARNSCENFWNKATNSNGEPFDRINANVEGKGKLLDQATGFLNQWGESLDEFWGEDEPNRGPSGASLDSSKKVLNDNVVYSRMKNSFQGNYNVVSLPGSDIKAPEMAMSLFGTIVTKVIDNKTTKLVHDPKSPAKGLTPLNLIMGPQGGEKIHFWKCSPETVAPEEMQCLDMYEEEDSDFKGLFPKFTELLAGSSTTPGILTKIRNREDLNSNELDFVKAFQMPYIKIAGLPAGIQTLQLSERFALMLAQQLVHQLYRETATVLGRALRASRGEGKDLTVEHKSEIEKYMAQTKITLKEMDEEVIKRIDAIDKTTVVMLAIKELNKSGDGTVGVR